MLANQTSFTQHFNKTYDDMKNGATGKENISGGTES